MKKKISRLWQRFVRWNGFVKLPLVLVFVLIFLLFVQNGSVFGLSVDVSEAPLQVYFFDVGQASSTLVITPSDMAILIDAGTSDTAGDLVQSIESVLEENSIDDLDILVMTHSDADHIGGVTSVLEAFNPSLVFRPLIASLDESDLATEKGCLMVTTQTYQVAISAVYEESCSVIFHSDMTIQLGDGCVMTMYAPQEAYYSDSNSYSPYIAIEYADATFLFTGDASQTRENELLSVLSESGISLKVDVLEVAHHGSKYSSSTAFLEAISPTYAVVSSGDSTHPSSEVLERLEEAGVSEVYLTKSEGTITVSVSEYGEIVFFGASSSLDLPLIATLWFCLLFIIFKIIDDKSAQKRQNLFIFRRNFE